MDISILTVSYRSPEDTLRCVQSLITGGAEGLDWEILIGDNGSGDCDSLRELSGHPNVRLMPGIENLGFGRENNRLAQLARGEFLLCLNPDTLVPQRTLQALVQHLRNTPLCGACAPRLLNPDGSRQYSWNIPMNLLWEFAEVHYLQNPWRDFFENRATRLYPDGPWDVGFSSGACLCLSKTLFDKCGGYDSEFFLNHEDIELCHRIRMAGHSVHVLPRLSVIHVDGGIQRKDWARFVKDRLDAKRVWFRKRYSGIELLMARMLWLEGILIRIAISWLVHRGSQRTRLKGYIDALRGAFHVH